ncbi:ferritin-like domain-containing protein [Spongorhabdus nitratireducens]
MLSFATSQKRNDRSERLISLLSAVADNELRTHRLYSQFLNSSADISATSGLTGLFKTALNEDRDHYHAIVECIKKLNGHSALEKQAMSKPASGHVNINKLLKTVRMTEAFSVKAYAEICAMTLEYDYSIFDLSYRNMNENMLHLDLVTDFLTSSPCQMSASG